MTHKAKDLSPDQKMAFESLLGRSIAENEEISIRTMTLPSAPEWLQAPWKSAKEQGLDQLSMKEIDAEIAAVSARGRFFSRLARMFSRRCIKSRPQRSGDESKKIPKLARLGVGY